MSSGRGNVGAALAALVLWSGSAVAETPSIDALPAAPPYCEAGHSNEYGHGTQTADGSKYCLNRSVSNRYVTPPDGWSPYVATFGLVTAFYPSRPNPLTWPVPPNYPRVVLHYHRGNPTGYPMWREVLDAGQMVNNGNRIRLWKVSNCPTIYEVAGDASKIPLSCEYEIRNYVGPDGSGGNPGNPPEWHEAFISEGVTGDESFASVGIGVGLIADGNHPPLVGVGVIPLGGATPRYRALANVSDPDDDPITGFTFDWGDGTQTQTKESSAEHTYAAGFKSNAYATVYATDSKGAAGSARARIGLTTLYLAASPGAKELLILAPGGFTRGHILRIDRGGPAEEDVSIVKEEFGTITVSQGIAFAHPAGTEVVDMGVPQPDAKVESSGNDVYNTTGQKQTKRADLTAGSTMTFRIDIENDGLVTSDFSIKGSEDVAPFVVRYFEGARGRTEITGEVKAGTYRIDALAAGESRALRMKVKAKRDAAVGTTGKLRVKAAADGSSLAQDIVKANLRIVENVGP